MKRLVSLIVSSLVAAGAVVGPAVAALPAQAATRGDCASAHNLMHVHRRLDGAIDQLNHDQHDYGGHRVHAMGDLQAARSELIAAESYARSVDRDNPSCFTTSGPTGGSDQNWGDRDQRGSNGNLWAVGRSVGRMIDELQRDERDYGGHRANAVNDMERAREELSAAERYARGRGY